MARLRRLISCSFTRPLKSYLKFRRRGWHFTTYVAPATNAPPAWRTTFRASLGGRISGRRPFAGITDPLDAPLLYPKMAVAPVGLPNGWLDCRPIEAIDLHPPAGPAVRRQGKHDRRAAPTWAGKIRPFLIALAADHMQHTGRERALLGVIKTYHGDDLDARNQSERFETTAKQSFHAQLRSRKGSTSPRPQ